MSCVHVKRLFELCEENDLKFSSSDLVHVVCKQCERDEVCPSLLLDQYESQESDKEPEDHPETSEAEQD